MADQTYAVQGVLVLTYNVSFEAMTNHSSGSAGALGRKCTPIGQSKLTICAQHMADTIDAIPNAVGADGLDFVGIQEASRWYELQAAAKQTLSQMAVVHSKANYTEMATFYHSGKYDLAQQVTSEFNPDRPFHILVLARKNQPGGAIFVNAHNPHHDDFAGVQSKLSVALDTLPLSAAEKQYRIIVVGDFNETDWNWAQSGLTTHQWSPFADAGIATQVSIGNFVYSCCQADGVWSDGQGGIRKGMRGGDYIFDSLAPADTRVPPTYDPTQLQSDHLPVMALLAA